MIRRVVDGAKAPLFAAAVAIVISAITVWIAGDNPQDAFGEMWRYIDSTASVVAIVNRAVPYYVAGIAVAIGFKMNLFNIGSNGQYILAAVLAAQLGQAVDLPSALHVGLMFVVAIAVGAAWASIPAILKVTRGVHEVISCIMLNTVATGLIAYLMSEHFRNPDKINIDETRPIPRSGHIPSLNSWFEALGFHFAPNVLLQGFLPFAVLLGIGYHFLLNRSAFGFNLRISGENPTAARTSGVDPKRMVLYTMLISGGIAGLIGIGPLLADPQFHKFGDQFPTQWGFTGLALALLGRNHPVGVAAAALVWATIERAAQPLSTIGIPREVATIMQGTFLLTAVIAYEVVRRRTEAVNARQAARHTTLHEVEGAPA